MRKTRFTQMVVLVCIGSLAGCTSGEGGTVGNTELNVIVPVGSDLSGPGTTPIDLQRVEYTINCEGTPSTFLDDNTPLPDDGAVQINGNLEVVDGRTSFASGKACNGGDENGRTCAAGQAGQDFCAPGGGTCDKVADFGPNLRNQSEIWQGFMDLPQGPCTVQLRARDGDGEVICTATENFQILPDVTTKVNVLMICDISFQAPVGSLDLDGSFSFVVGNFCPDLFVLNCNAQDEPVQVVDTFVGPQAPSLCEVRFRDVDSTCGENCDPQTCVETPEGLDCTAAASPGVSTKVTCVATPPNSGAVDCGLDGTPDFTPVTDQPSAPCASSADCLGAQEVCDIDLGGSAGVCLANGCDFAGDTLGEVGGQPSGPLNPAPGGFAIGFALCTQAIVDNAPIPGLCDADNKVGNPLFSGATVTCTAVTTDGDDDCNKSKSVTVTGPGDSPCVQVGCFPGEDCAFCDDGIECSTDTCDDSSGAPSCVHEPRGDDEACFEFAPAGGLCSGFDFTCEIQGCNVDEDCTAGDPDSCTGQAPCNQTTLTCDANPPANENGACDSSGTGSGSGICDDAGTCVSNDQCIVDADCGDNTNDCLTNVCNTGVTPYACATVGTTDVNGDPARCDNGVGVCNVVFTCAGGGTDGDVCDPDNNQCANDSTGQPVDCEIDQNGDFCELPPIVSTCNGTQSSSIGCLVTGTLEVPLDVAVDLAITVPTAGADVQVEYFLSAVNPTFVLAGVAADTAILGLSLNTGVTGGTPAVISAQNEATVPDQELSAFLALPPAPLPPATANEIILAVNPVDENGDPITNVCGQVANSTCAQGPIPRGIDLATRTVLPASAADPTTYEWNGEVELTISALGGALILQVNTADPDICGPACAPGTPNEGSCDALAQGPVISCGSESQ